jgi:DNA-binding transcriptional ArsR family regulator
MNERVLNSALKREDTIVRQVGDEFLVYDLKTNKAHCLNRVAAEVWMLCDGKTTVAEIVRKVGETANFSVDEAVIDLALSRLQKAGLIEQDSSRSEPMIPSRRVALRKMATAVLALPLVTTIRVPTAAQAASPTQRQRPVRRQTRSEG